LERSANIKILPENFEPMQKQAPIERGEDDEEEDNSLINTKSTLPDCKFMPIQSLPEPTCEADKALYSVL